jgi:hypothetical protein
MQALTAIVFLSLGIMLGAIAASESIEVERYGADYWGTRDTYDCGE